MRDTAGRTGVQSVARAVGVLELLAEGRGELSITELGRRLGVHKATASRLVSTLADHGLVERNPATERYRLGGGLIRLAGAAAAGVDLVRQARESLERLAEETQETVNLAILDGDQVVNVDQIAGSRRVVSVSWVGRRTPLHCTSNGKILLAHLPDSARGRLLRMRLDRLTPATITDTDLLEAQLLEVRVRGYATTVGELEEGLNAVAAPIRGAAGSVIAAVSVSGPVFRLTRTRIAEIARPTKEAAHEISRRLGYVDRGLTDGPSGRPPAARAVERRRA